MRQVAYKMRKFIGAAEDKDIRTSCSLPNWQKFRLKASYNSLVQQLNTAGFNIEIHQGTLEVLAMKLLMRNINKLTTVARRTIRYNDNRPKYCKINLPISEAADYLTFRSKRNQLHISVSYMMDVALRLYLSLAVRLLFLKLTGISLKKKWNVLLDHLSNYNTGKKFSTRIHNEFTNSKQLEDSS